MFIRRERSRLLLLPLVILVKRSKLMIFVIIRCICYELSIFIVLARLHLKYVSAIVF